MRARSKAVATKIGKGEYEKIIIDVIAEVNISYVSLGTPHSVPYTQMLGNENGSVIDY